MLSKLWLSNKLSAWPVEFIACESLLSGLCVMLPWREMTPVVGFVVFAEAL